MDIPPVTHYRASEPVSCEAREVREHVYTDPLCKIGTNFGAGGVLSWYSIYIYCIEREKRYTFFPFSVLLAPTATAGGARSHPPASLAVSAPRLFTARTPIPVLQ